MAEHDRRFKVLLQEFLPDFLQMFFPERAELFDMEQVEWLDKELFVDPPQGEVLLVDLVARLRLRSGDSGSALALVHMEVESRDAVVAIRRRMFDYYVPLRRNHDCPVLPIAVYLRVGRDGIGVDSYTEEFGGLAILRFQYSVRGLAGPGGGALCFRLQLVGCGLGRFDARGARAEGVAACRSVASRAAGVSRERLSPLAVAGVRGGVSAIGRRGTAAV